MGLTVIDVGRALVAPFHPSPSLIKARPGAEGWAKPSAPKVYVMWGQAPVDEPQGNGI